jgi:hypothetical protein
VGGRDLGRRRRGACSAPQDLELYAASALPDELGDRYPEVGALEVFAHAHGELAFEPYVGRSWLSSELDYVALIPSPAGWQDDDRLVSCGLFRMDGDPLAASAAGSGW